MSNEFVSANPGTFVDRGFLTGRVLTLGGVRAASRPLKSGDSARVGMQFFFTEVAKDGEKRILSGFMHDGAWSDQMRPSDNLKGLVPESGADRPFVEKNSPLGLFNTSLASAGCPPALMNGNYQKYVGMEVMLEEKTLPSFKRKKSVDPDEAPAPQKDFKCEVVSKLVTLPADNKDYTPLTEKEITAHLKEKADRSSARKAAASSEDEPTEAVASDDDEDPARAPKKGKGKKAAPVEDDDDDAAPDSFGDADDDDDEPAAADEPEEDESEENALAAKLILKVLKAEKKVKGSALLQKVHPLLAGTEKKLTAKVLKLVQSPKFIAGIDGVSVKNNMVVLG